MKQKNMIVKDVVRYLSVAYQSTIPKKGAAQKTRELNCKTHR